MTRKPVREMIPKGALKSIKEQGIAVRYKAKGKSVGVKYAKVRNLEVFTGYDLLENMLVARPYIQKRYNIDLGLLELLIFLSPKQYFTQKDYAEMPKQYKYCSIKNLMNTGFVGIIQTGSCLSDHIYNVNKKGSEIVRHFYEVLSGEKKIPEDYTNPLARKKSRTPFDKKKMDLIEKINLLPAPEKKKALYR